MIISIVSEMDTRTVLYSLMQVIHRYGRVCVISTNKYLSRLIDGTFEDDFCGIHIIIAKTEEDISNFDFGAYDYVIVDGVVIKNADKIIAVVGHKVSLNFGYELEALVDHEDFNLLKCGDRPKAVTTKKNSKTTNSSDDNDNHENDWAKDVSAQEKLSELFSVKKSEWIPFMSSADFEMLEGEHKWSTINKTMYSRIYDIIGANLGIDKYTYMKGGSIKDENGDCFDSISVW